MNTEQTPDMEKKIIEAAKIVFVRKGFEATKMGDIAAQAGIGRTALHYYFRTKEMLFDAIFGQIIEKIFPNIETVAVKEIPLLDKLDEVIDLYAGALLQNSLLPVFVAREMDRDVEHLLQALLKNKQQLAPLFKLGEQLKREMEAGTLRKVSLADVFATLASLMVFPILTRNMVTSVFCEGNEERFVRFYLDRKPLVSRMMRLLLDPHFPATSNY